MMDFVLMCSGQGSQKPGMGACALSMPEVAQAAECASDICGVDVSALLTSADAETLANTRNSQLAISALSIGLSQALLNAGAIPKAALGFSLGQISALAVCGMLSTEETFALLDVRSKAMERVASKTNGAMTALLKITHEQAEALCREVAQEDVLVPANYNCPGQVVVSGSTAAIERAEAAWKEHGGRTSRLATTGAFHSPLMQEAADELAAYLETLTFRAPRFPMICNVDAKPLMPEAAHKHLALHLAKPVRFSQSVSAVLEASPESAFVEAGFGGVLVNLVKRIEKQAPRFNVCDGESLEACKAALEGEADVTSPQNPAATTSATITHASQSNISERRG